MAVYARLTRFKTAPGARQRLEKLNEEVLLPLFRSQPGFKSLSLLIDGDNLEERYAGLSLWESREAAAAAATAIDPVVQRVLVGHVEGKVRPRIYEVVGPKT